MLVFPDEYDNVSQYLEAAGISPLKSGRHKSASPQRVLAAKTDYLKTWYLEEALMLLFKKVDAVLPKIMGLIKTYNARAIINIAFWHYGIYPALSIAGKNMEYIRLLQADIDIDPYDGSHSDGE